MKSFLVALLISTASAYLGEKTWSLKTLQDHRTDSEIQAAYAAHSTAQANARPPYQSAVQLNWAMWENESNSDLEQ